MVFIFVILAFNFILAVFFPGKLGYTENWLWSIIILSIGGGGLTYLKFHLDRGYLISYDDSAIYMRPHGVRWNFTRAPEEVMAFADIEEVVGENEGAAMAFKYVRLYRKQWDGAEKFILSPFFINSDDMKALVLLIDQKRPGTVAADVLRVMNNPRRL